MTTTTERIWLVSYTLNRSSPTFDERTGWCWCRPDPNSRGEGDRDWHKLPRVSHGRETWRPGVYGDGQHLAEAKAAVETVVGLCVWPDLTMTQLRAHRRIVIDGQEGRIHAFAIGIPVASETEEGAAETESEIRENNEFVHVTVRSPVFPDGREFRFPKDHAVGTAAHVAAGKLMHQGRDPTFETHQRVVLDRNLTLEAAGVRNRDVLDLVDAGTAR